MSKKTTKKTTKAAGKNRVSAAEQEREAELKRWILIVVLAAITLIAYMRAGIVGVFLNNLQRFLFGRVYFIVMVIIMIQILIVIVNGRSQEKPSKNPIAIILIVLAVLLWCSYADTDATLKGMDILKSYTSDLASYFSQTPPSKVGGGIVGAALYSVSTILLDRTGTVLIITVLFIIAMLLLVSLEVYKHAFQVVADYLSTEDLDEDEDDEDLFEEEPPLEEEPLPLEPPKTFLRVDPMPEAEPVKPIEGLRSSMPNIQADETDVSKADTPEVYEEPTQRSAFDIRVDQPDLSSTDSLTIPTQVKSEPVEVKPEPVRSIFLDVDELEDKVAEGDAPIEATPSYEAEPVEELASYDEPYEEPLVEDYAEEEEEETPVQPPVAQTVIHGIESARKRTNKPYKLPPLTLLDPVPPRSKEDPNVEAAEEKSELLINILRNFGIDSVLLDTHIGPAVTKFEIRPDANVKVSKILGLIDDIKMQMAVRDIRIEAPIPGHNAVGVEIPNVKAVAVKMKECITRVPEKDVEQKLIFILGKDLLGSIVTCRLDKMPHILIAGATGSGKSVCMNTIITSFLLRTKPDEVKLLLIDPKKVEFTPYHKVPHLIGPVINDAAQASNALKAIVKIMEDRYDIFSKCGVRNIQVYNEKVEDGSINVGLTEAQPKYQKMPYIVVIIDELADLMVVAGRDVESSIQRITQLARAAGIHLIVATQRPSTDVITGIIKANIPSRIAFSVSSGIDSRTILDHIGAERLLGNGDMLYLPIGQNAANRVQGVFVTDGEVQRICDFVSKQAVPMYDDCFVRLEGVEGNDGTAVAGEDADPLLIEVKEFVVDQQKASTSLLQRRFGIGYNRAARMIDLLEQQGIIGPQQGSKPREVYMKRESGERSLDEE